MENLRKAFNEMVVDQGLNTPSPEDWEAALRTLRENESEDRILQAEESLKLLTEDEILTLASGCEEDWPRIYEKLPHRDIVHEILDEIFMQVGI